MTILQLIDIDSLKNTFVLVDKKYEKLVSSVNGKSLQIVEEDDNLDEIANLLIDNNGNPTISSELGTIVETAILTYLKKCDQFCIFWIN